LIFRLPKVPLESLAAHTLFTAPELCVLSFLAFVVALNIYGISKWLIDAVYIYFFPFVLIWYAFKWSSVLAWKISKALARLVSLQAVSEDWQTAMALLGPSTLNPLPSSIQPPPAEVKQSPSKANKKTHSTFVCKLWKGLRAPFTHFTLTWCVLIVVSLKPALLGLATLVIIAHTLRFLGTLVVTALGVNRVFVTAEQKLTEMIRQLTHKVLKYPLEAPVDTDLRTIVSQLAGIRFLSFLIHKRSEILHGALTLAVGVYVLIYLRLVFLFTFLYFGIAKIGHIKFGLLDSVVSALLMPLSFGDLPHNSFMKFFAGAQSAIVVLLGVGAVGAYLQRKLNAVQQAAGNVWEVLNSDDVKVRIEHFQARQPPIPSSGPNPS